MSGNIDQCVIMMFGNIVNRVNDIQFKEHEARAETTIIC